MSIPFDIGNQTLLISIACFLALFLFSLGVAQSFKQRSARRDLIGKIRGGGIAIEDYSELENGEEKPVAPIRGFLGKLGRHTSGLKPEDYSSFRLRFLRAGIRNENALAIHWGVKIVMAAFLPAAFLLIRALTLTVLNYQITMVLAVLCALLGFYLPDIWLAHKAEMRRQTILRSLPDALDLMVICVEAGMGLDSAISKVAQELSLGSPELSDEFNLLNLELRAGKQRTDALRNLAKRTNLDEISSLTTLLVQTDKFGTSVADALRVYSDSYRTQRYQRAEELAAKLPVKMVIPLLFCIFPALFLVIIGPAVINIYRVLIKGAFAQ